MSNSQQSLYQLGRTLIALHYQGYKPGYGYSFVQRDDQFGEGAIYLSAVCIPPPERADAPKRSWWRLWRRG